MHHGRHAIAVDEQRDDFTPTLWDADPRITQMLFPGSHSDVGGGYPIATGRRAVGLRTGVDDEANSTKLGLLFSPSPSYVARPLAVGASGEPWLEAPWTFLPHRRQDVPTRDVPVAVRDRPPFGCPLNPAYAPGNLADYLDRPAAEPHGRRHRGITFAVSGLWHSWRPPCTSGGCLDRPAADFPRHP